MMDCLDLLVILDLEVILVKMVPQALRVYLDLLAQLVIEDLLVLLEQEGFKVCLGPQESLVNRAKMGKMVLWDSLE